MSTYDSDAVLARLTEPTVEEPLSFAVIADPHVTPRAEGTPMVYHRSADRLRSALEDAAARGVDAVISAGDLTKDGAPWEYGLVDEILAESDLPFFSVPGNHDAPKAPREVYEYGDDHETPPIERFERRYTPKGSLPFVEPLGELDVIGLNTATMRDKSLAKTHDGEVSEEDVTWLETALTDATNPVVLMHHNTPAMYDQFRSFRDRAFPEMGIPPVIRNPEPLIDVLTANEVPLVITGHLHNVGVAKTGPVTEVTTPATGSFPQAYLVFELSASGTVVKYVPVTDLDGMIEAHHARRTGGPKSAGYTAFASARLARLPLVDEFRGLE